MQGLKHVKAVCAEKKAGSAAAPLWIDRWIDRVKAERDTKRKAHEQIKANGDGNRNGGKRDGGG